MKAYLLEKFPDLEDFPVRLEKTSMDSVENAKLVTEMLGDDSEGTTLLVTEDWHMLRARQNFQRQGITVEEVPAETIVSDRSSHHEKFIQDYLRSSGTKRKQATELALRGMMKIDPQGRLLTTLACKLRDN